ncbi:MAG: lamin tail domain-containing protein, partial [Planctomycetota bacterium]
MMSNKLSTLAVVTGMVCLLSASSLPAQDEVPFVRADLNQDAVVDISDSVLVLMHLFRPGTDIPCEKSADVDDSGEVNLTDAVYGMNYLFQNGPRPPAPSGRCGFDPTEDALSCDSSPGDIGSDETVVISEILAANNEGLEDEDGDTSDWIELHLVSEALVDSVDLGGWYLTGNEEALTAWQFPAGVTIDRGGYLVVFASGKNRAIAGEELHTSFRMNSSGEYLALVAPDGVTVVDELAPFPPQLDDVSYGRAQAVTSLVGARASVRYKVPTSGDSGDDWAAPDFDTTGWRSGRPFSGSSRAFGRSDSRRLVAVSAADPRYGARRVVAGCWSSR